MMLSKDEALKCINKAKREDVKRWNNLKRFVKKQAGKHDADGNEKLDEQELQAAMEQFYQDMQKWDDAKGKAEEAINFCDSNSDAEISKDEAMTCLQAAKEADPTNPQWQEIEDNMEKRFDKADKNGNGSLDKKELAKEIIKQGY